MEKAQHEKLIEAMRRAVCMVDIPVTVKPLVEKLWGYFLVEVYRGEVGLQFGHFDFLLDPKYKIWVEEEINENR